MVRLLPKEVFYHHNNTVALPVYQLSTMFAWFLMVTSTISYVLMLIGDGLTMIGKRKFDSNYRDWWLKHNQNLIGTFSNQEITWYLPRKNVKSVELVFKDDNYMIGTDLKIFYNQPKVWHGESDIASFGHTISNGAQNTHIENLFDDSFETWYTASRFQRVQALITTFHVSN